MIISNVYAWIVKFKMKNFTFLGNMNQFMFNIYQFMFASFQNQGKI
jgi:hypothetical protein